MSFIKRADKRLVEIKERANKELEKYGDRYREVHSTVMDVHTDNINGKDGVTYMKKCLETGIVENKTLVADYLADKDPEFAVAVMGLALTKSAADLAHEACDPDGWAYNAFNNVEEENFTTRYMVEKLIETTMNWDKK